MRRRSSPGKVIVYREAMAFARERWKWFAGGWLVALTGFGVIWALPYDPFAKGVHVGILAMLALGWTLWLLWHVSGLLPRLEGTWAEEWTGDELDRHPNVLQRIPNLRFAEYDIDQVAVTRSGILAVESKMRGYLTEHIVEADVVEAARRGRSLRHQLRTLPEAKQLGADSVTAVLVYWGRGGRDLEPQSHRSTLGDVTVVGNRHLEQWLAGRGTGLVGPDYAERVAAELEALAQQRDAKHRPDGVLLRHLTRTR